jgi:CheY-like chemotaxis protein
MSAPPKPPPARSALVVDDEAVVRMIARTMLSAAGYAVSEAADSTAARAAVKSAGGPFDLIVLDLTLSAESGAALIPEFRAQSPASRILLVTGSSLEDAAGLGADGFLSKPFTRATLLAAADRVLGTT